MNKNSILKHWAATLPPKLYCTLLLLLSIGVQAQTTTITGTITDASGTLPGVTIKIKDKPTATLSNENGNYSLVVASNDILVFSFIGYKTIEVPVTNHTTINIKLQEDTTALKEVVVNAGYYNVKEKERTGSISKISSKDIEKQPVTNVLGAMQCRMAGVNITQTTGVPGGGFLIEIRGQNSLRSTGNDPLYIIDGVPYSSESIGSTSTSSLFGGAISPLNSINPDTIESIEVLKDADATAIYGSRGSNGVVLITTKKGKAGKTRFTANYSRGEGQVTRFMNLMHTEQYLAMRREAYANDGITTYPANAYDINGAWDQNRYTDWQKVLTGGSAEITNLSTTLTGGSSQTQFLLSGNFSKQTTVFPGDFRYKKGNVHLSTSHESDNKKFRVLFSGGYTVQDNNQPYLDFTRESRLLAPNAPALYDANGNLNWQNNTFTNPLRHLNGKYNALTYDLLANTTFSYQLLKNIELKSAFGFSDLRHEETSTAPSTLYNPAFGIGSDNSVLFVNTANRNSWIVEPQLNWNKSFGKAVVSVLVGGTFQNKTSNQIVHQALGFPSNSLIYNLAAASNVTITQNEESEYRYQAFFGRVNLNWNEKYIINVTGRRDGSSRFGPGKQFATFGAVGAAWLFSNEAILKNSSLLSFGKLRASYGTTGSDQIGDYQFLDTYTTTGVSYDGTVGLEPTRLYNSNFGWETNKKLEMAFETGFFKDRIFITAGWYSNRSSNQLVGIPLPGTTGFSSLQANLNATVENQGLELTLRTLNFQNKDFSWSSSINFTTSRNKLVSFPGLEASTYRNQFSIGSPLNIVKVYHFTGIDTTTGLYQFEDVNGDGVITETDDKQTVKDLNPQFFGGLQNQIKYKQFQLDFLFQFVKQENYNSLKTFPMPGTRNNQLAGTTNAWQNAGDEASYQLYSVTNSTVRNAYLNYTESDASISDASYIRLKNIALYYDLPDAWLKHVKCRISFTGQNLLTFTKYKGADPEFKTNDYLPPLKVFTTGVQLIF
jgi:TonB-linked SusC/RagA family outer membrane protein